MSMRNKCVYFNILDVKIQVADGQFSFSDETSNMADESNLAQLRPGRLILKVAKIFPALKESINGIFRYVRRHPVENILLAWPGRTRLKSTCCLSCQQCSRDIYTGNFPVNF